MNNKTVEVRSNNTNQAVVTFEVTEKSSTNYISMGYEKLCKRFGINRATASMNYYVTTK